jgi:hypothetical protein
MTTTILVVGYVACTVFVQAIGFGISRLVEHQWPTSGTMTFLIIFMLAFAIAWPITVRMTAFLLAQRRH